MWPRQETVLYTGGGLPAHFPTKPQSDYLGWHKKMGTADVLQGPDCSQLRVAQEATGTTFGAHTAPGQVQAQFRWDLHDGGNPTPSTSHPQGKPAWLQREPGPKRRQA
ncbi:UNVERIFIED_CONTAM: hypothetical protein K2H54_046183 [Gekko kuhli]